MTVMETGLNFYTIELVNQGGLVMPIVLQVDYEDESTEEIRIPAEIWRRNPKTVRKLIVLEKGDELTSVIVDPDWETADSSIDNNSYPRKIIPSRIESFKEKKAEGFPHRDIMKDSKTELKSDDDDDDEEKTDEGEKDE